MCGPGTWAKIIAIVKPRSWLTARSVASFIPDFTKIQKKRRPSKTLFKGSCPGLQCNQVCFLEIKFHLCNEASFGFSASKASFGFAASNVFDGRFCNFQRLWWSKSFVYPLHLQFPPKKILHARESETLMPCWGTFPSFAWKNANLSTIPRQEVGNHVLKNCISSHIS